MREPGAVSLFRGIGGAWIKLKGTAGRHQEYITEVRVACPAEVGVREADDCAVGILVAGAVLIYIPVVAAVSLVG